jgi:hypothetical protein
VKEMASRLGAMQLRLRKRRAAPLTSRACRDAANRLTRVALVGFVDERLAVDRGGVVRAGTLMMVPDLGTAGRSKRRAASGRCPADAEERGPSHARELVFRGAEAAAADGAG